jgi:hypothetical protein
VWSSSWELWGTSVEGIRDLEDADLIEWTIGVELVEEGGSWKVFGFDYTAAPRFGTLRVTQLVRKVAPAPVHR